MFSTNIYESLSRFNHNDHHLKRYCKYISSIKILDSEYHEMHHILPASLFPEYSDFKINPLNNIIPDFDKRLG